MASVKENNQVLNGLCAGQEIFQNLYTTGLGMEVYAQGAAGIAISGRTIQSPSSLARSAAAVAELPASHSRWRIK
jgi:hypothetical protein